jgi:hypothetical protein
MAWGAGASDLIHNLLNDRIGVAAPSSNCANPERRRPAPARNEVTINQRRGAMVDGAMVDLIFIYASETDFLITAYSERGQQWLVDSANTIIIESETNAGQPPIIVGKCWIESKAEFERLYAKAAAGGGWLTVLIEIGRRDQVS